MLKNKTKQKLNGPIPISSEIHSSVMLQFISDQRPDPMGLLQAEPYISMGILLTKICRKQRKGSVMSQSTVVKRASTHSHDLQSADKCNTSS